MASRHMKGVQLIISEMHIGTVRYFLIPVGIAIAMVWVCFIHSTLSHIEGHLLEAWFPM